MKHTNNIRTIDKKTPAITKAITQPEFVELKDKTIEEKRLKLALDLRRF